VRSNATILSIGAAVIGIAVVVVSEVAGISWARIIGIGLISLGGIGVGIASGLGDERPGRWLGRLRDARVALGVALTIVMVVPVAAALVGAVVGFFSAVGSGLNPAVVSGGGLIALLMLAAAVGSVWISVRAIRRAASPATAAAPSEVPAGEERG